MKIELKDVSKQELLVFLETLADEANDAGLPKEQFADVVNIALERCLVSAVGIHFDEDDEQLLAVYY